MATSAGNSRWTIRPQAARERAARCLSCVCVRPRTGTGRVQRPWSHSGTGTTEAMTAATTAGRRAVEAGPCLGSGPGSDATGRDRPQDRPGQGTSG